MARMVKQWLKEKTITKIAEFFQITRLLQRTRLRYSEKDSEYGIPDEILTDHGTQLVPARDRDL